MSLVVEHPQLPTPAALGDETSAAVHFRPDEADEARGRETAEPGPDHHPPSGVLLMLGSVAVWVGLALAVRRLLDRG